ncbi:MAG: hypothetical protein HKN13_00120, partial [Rhodothermales bacterium]|nr:hypothetical protein [Rhodothermales bacterium]
MIKTKHPVTHYCSNRKPLRSLSIAIALILTCTCLVPTSALAQNDVRVESLQLVFLNRGTQPVTDENPVAYLENANPWFEVRLAMEVSYRCVSWTNQTCHLPTMPTESIPMALYLRTDPTTFVALATDLIFPASSVQWRTPIGNFGGDTEPVEVTFGTSNPNFNPFVVDSWPAEPEFLISIMPTSAWVDDDGTNNFRTEDSPRFLSLSGEIAFGPAQVTLDHVPAPSATFGCGAPTLVNIQGSANWSPGATWENVPFTIDGLCAQAMPTATSMDLAITDSNTLSLGSTSGRIAGFDATVVGSELGQQGARPQNTPNDVVTVSWPADYGLSFHKDIDSRPESLGRPAVSFGQDDLLTGWYGTYEDLDARTTGGHIISETLPFFLHLAGLTISATGLDGSFDQSSYRFNLPFSAADRRSGGKDGLATNDIRFSNPAAFPGGSVSFQIAAPDASATGLMIPSPGPAFGDVSIGRLHFPLMDADTFAFDVEVSSGSISGSLGAVSDSVYTFALNPDCAGCDATGAGEAYQLTATNEGIDATSAIAGQATIGTNATWGPLDTAAGTRIFERHGDENATATIYIPGIVAPNTADQQPPRVSDSLLGMREIVDLGSEFRPNAHYGLSTPTSRNGDHFMAGANLGPELYHDGREPPTIGIGQDLSPSNPDTTIGFGGLSATNSPDYHVVPSNIATKYVVRAGGVTGVFNTDPADVPDPQIYGYQTDLTEFGFRVVNNVVDDESLINGEIYVPGKGDFTVAFQSLAVDCTGQVSDGVVVREECDGVGPDLNCDERLSAWQTEVELQSLGFQPIDDNAELCDAGDRELVVGNTAAFKSLDDPLGMLAAWSADGLQVDLRALTGSTNHVLDRPVGASGDDDQGFPIAFTATPSLETPNDGLTDGYLEAEVLIGVPFWDAPAAFLRVANDDVHTQSQSIVLGDASGLDDSLANRDLVSQMRAYPLPASYTWGSTGWSASLDMYYEAGRHSDFEHPRLAGETGMLDLVIFDVSAGVDYVDPDRTELSLGASADFDTLDLAGFDLSLSLNDPESLASIDEFLCGLLGCSTPGPLRQLLGDVYEKLDLVNAVTDAGLDGFIESGVRTAVEDMARPEIEAAAKALAYIQSAPAQFASATTLGLEDVTNELLVSLSDQLDQDVIYV